jgi:hypothetical protein
MAQSRTQITRTEAPDDPPAAGSLQPGELYVEMSEPVRVWVGVPASVTPQEQLQLVDLSATLTAGTGLSGGGLLAGNLTVAHADTSTQDSVANVGADVLQSVGLDGMGHVISLGSVTLTPGLIGAAPAEHLHEMDNVNGLSAALGTKAPLTHTHSISQVTGLQLQLDNKANLSGATFTGRVRSTSFLADPVGGSADRGGAYELAKPPTGSSLSGNVQIWIVGNRLEFRESVSPYRGLYFDFTQTGANVVNGILHSGATDLVETMVADILPDLLAAQPTVIPAGTRMLFYQAAAPTGWTKLTDANLNDRGIRVLSTEAGGGVWGTRGFWSTFTQTLTDYHVLTTAQVPSLSVSAPTAATESGSDVQRVTSVSVSYGSTPQGHAHNLDLRLKFIDVIICSKN